VEMAIQPGQTITLPNLQVAEGSVLRVRFKDDPVKKYLETAKARHGDALIGVVAPSGRFHSLRVTAEDANGRSHEIAIPTDTPLQLEIYGSLIFADEKGLPFFPAQPIGRAVGQSGAGQGGGAQSVGQNPIIVPVRHGAGQNNPDVTLTITGVK
jgi:hypothetical protein